MEKYKKSAKASALALLAPQVRLELTTLRLTAECSAIELLRIIAGRAFRPSLPRSLPEREKLPFLPLPLLDPGDFLLSQAVPSSVPSAFGGLTSVFGMGTGGSLQPLSPETLMSPSRALTSGLLARFRSRFRLRSLAVRSTPSKLHRVQVDLQAFTFSLDQALDRLVSPSSTPHSASTDDLSTSSSLRGLTCLKQWQSSSSGGLHA